MSRTVRDHVHGAIGQIESLHSLGLTGLSTGFRDLDIITLGLRSGELIVIGARPSIGKTALACTIVEFVAVESQTPVGFLSMEMTAEQLMLRMLCARARVNQLNIAAGYLAERDLPKLTGAAGKLAQMPLFIDDSTRVTTADLPDKILRMVQEHGIKLAVIDYLQLIRPETVGSDGRYDLITEAATEIKAMALEAKIPIIVLSQLNRSVEYENRRPRLTDLRDSGCIEECADIVGLLYPHCDEPGAQAVPTNLLIAKSRNVGVLGDVPLTFLKPYLRFESAAQITEEDIPKDE